MVRACVIFDWIVGEAIRELDRRIVGDNAVDWQPEFERLGLAGGAKPSGVRCNVPVENN